VLFFFGLGEILQMLTNAETYQTKSKRRVFRALSLICSLTNSK
jgi:hypothetical protein